VIISGPAKSISKLLFKLEVEERGVATSSKRKTPASSTEQRPRRQIIEVPFDDGRNIYEYKPRRQFELIRNIHFQSLQSSPSIRAGSGRTSRLSCRAMKPLEPLKRLRPYSFMYNFLQSSLSPASLAQFLLTGCVEQRSSQGRCEKIWRISSSYRNASKLKGELREDADVFVPTVCRRFGVGSRMSGEYPRFNMVGHSRRLK